MFDKLQGAKDRYDEIGERLMDPSVVSDNAKYKALMKEYKSLTPVVDKYEEYRKAKSELDEAKELLDAGGMEPDFRAMVEEQLQTSKERIETVSEELRILLLPSDPNDERNVIMEIRGGAGGDEAALFAHSLYRMYCMYAENMRWKTEVMNINDTELGGIKEVSFLIQGEGAYSRLKFESGVHRVQRVPETETAGRIHTSTATVAVLPEVEEIEQEPIPPGDLQVDTYRASGAGGQHVNKTESAIRITHKPTGIVVECQEERSQHKNREKAMKVLYARLYEMKLAEQNRQMASQRKLQVGTGDRSERIRTYNFPQGRVSDHRINLTLYKIEAILNGELTELIDALITFDQAEKLQSQSEA